MLWTIFVILVVLWLLGLVTSYTLGGFVHILFGGRIVENGGPELVDVLEREGYDWVRARYPEAAKDEDELEQNAPAGQLAL